MKGAWSLFQPMANVSSKVENKIANLNLVIASNQRKQCSYYYLLFYKMWWLHLCTNFSLSTDLVHPTSHIMRFLIILNATQIVICLENVFYSPGLLLNSNFSTTHCFHNYVQIIYPCLSDDCLFLKTLLV